MLGMQGLAVGGLMWTRLFVTSGGQTSARLQAEYELLITQQLVRP